MRLDEKRVRDEGTKSAQPGDKPQLTELLSQIEIEIDRLEMKSSMLFRYSVFQPDTSYSEKKKAEKKNQRVSHNSFRKKAAQASAR